MLENGSGQRKPSEQFPRSPFAAGQCDSCQANEASATIAYVVGPGDYVYENDPGCDSDTNTAINKLVQACANSQVLLPTRGRLCDKRLRPRAAANLVARGQALRFPILATCGVYSAAVADVRVAS